MPILNDKQYRCDFCGEIFGFERDESWNEDKREKEFKTYFPSSSTKNRDIVCDDCWNMVKPPESD